MLLTRLFSDCNEENKYNSPKSKGAATAIRHDFLVCQESDIKYKEHHKIHGNKLLELDSRSYSSDHLSSPMFHGSDGRIISFADFSTNHSDEFYPSYHMKELECNFGGTASFRPRCITDPDCNFRETAHFSVNKVMTHGCLLNEQEHKTLAWNHFDGPVKLRGEPYPLLLENSLDGSLDEMNTPQVWDIQYEEQYHMPKEKLLELDSSSYSSDHLASPIFQRSDDRMFQLADFSTYHSHKFNPSCSITEPECYIGETRFSVNCVMTHGFLFNELEHKTLAWNHLSESGKLGREPYPFLLENGLCNPGGEIHIPINHNNTKLDRSPALLPSIGNCKEMLNNILGAHNLSCSSILTNQPLDLNSMLDSGLLRYQEYRFGKYVYDGLDTDFYHNSSSLSYNEDHLKLSE